MGKRSNFERVDKDYYQTPPEAVRPLAPFLPEGHFTFIEPCAGDGRLIRHITELAPGAQCLRASDIEPDADEGIDTQDALTLDTTVEVAAGLRIRPDLVITNPPWSRDRKSGFLLHRMIERFVEIAPTWLLFDSDWMHTMQAQPYMSQWCSKIVSIGRVKWIEGSKMTGKDNCCWYLFDKRAREFLPVPMIFGRGITPFMK